MPPSPLTHDHRRRQLALRAQTLREFLRLYPSFDLNDIKRTWPALEAAVVALTKERGRVSSALAADYYRDHRKAEGVPGGFSPVLATVPTDQIVRGLVAMGPVNAAAQIAKGRDPSDVRQTTLVNLSGVLGLYLLNHGRRTLLDSIKKDNRARGWQRVTSPGACTFCTEIASRGAVFKEATADFEAHRHCACSAEPVF